MITTTAMAQLLDPERLAIAARGVAAETLATGHSALQANIAALVEAAAVLTGVLEASGDCIKILDLDGRILYINDSGQRLLEIDEPDGVLRQSWADRWPAEPAAGAAIAAARAGRASHFSGPARTLRGDDRHWDVNVTPIRSGSIDVTQILVISRDVTERQRLEMQKATLAEELEHRIKNILTMVIAISRQTLRAPATLAEASINFTARITALAHAQAVLTHTHWSSVDIGAVVDAALAPHRIGGAGGQFHVSGPRLALSADRAQALTLALHELATNAVKYGALSVAAGEVRLRWHVGGSDEFRLEWIEENGPPVAPPAQIGFGSRLIERVLAAEFGGTVQIAYHEAGVRCTLAAPLA